MLFAFGSVKLRSQHRAWNAETPTLSMVVIITSLHKLKLINSGLITKGTLGVSWPTSSL